MRAAPRLISGFIAALAAGPAAAGPPVDYATQVKPLLERHCVSCHGVLRKQGGLRLDAAQFLRAGGESGDTLVPGDPGASLLVAALKGEGGLDRMPKEADPLPAEQIALIERWVAEGAAAPEDEPVEGDPEAHWAFRPVRRPAVPVAGGAANPVDAFVAEKRQAAGLTAAGEAPKHVLLRRVYLDLVGVPPGVEELRAFLADDSPDAYEKVVDRLLADPRHGERWGRHWMDVWRYSDWYGWQAELRNSQRHIWRWRDWIVESLNEGKPYDRMVVEMLAADEVAPADQDALRATGFLARNYYKFNRDVWLDKTVEHTGKAFVGLTFNCARCHDHMFDPVTQREYYALRAFFEPHQVRVEPIAGVLDEMKDGLPRVFDADPNAVTYLYVRGNDKHPDKEHPLSPVLPAFFVPETPAPSAVTLPPVAYYAGLRPEVRAALRKQAEAEVVAADEGVRQLVGESVATGGSSGGGDVGRRSALADEPPVAPTKSASGAAETQLVSFETGHKDPVTAERPWPSRRRVAEAKLLAARARREALEARIAADDAKYARPPQGNAEALALAAATVERGAGLATKQAEELAAKLALADAQAKPEAERAKAVEEAQKALDAAAKAVEAARAEAQKVDGNYSPLTTVHPATSTGRRTVLARWIADPTNPLTARVAVNHVWARHVGRPIVESVFDFGMHGATPTHPELLDWLAAEFVAGGWDFKRLHRVIVTSGTYRMSSEFGMGSAESVAGTPHSALSIPNSIDPDNRLLWRMNARRAEGEVIRDSLLAVTGTLEERLGGPELPESEDQTTRRRSLYYRHAPEKYAQFLMTFDGANADECYRRAETVVPQQALAEVNSRLTREQSRLLSAELFGDGGRPREELVAAAFERVLGRSPSSEERAACGAFLDEQEARLANAGGLTPIENGPDVSVPAADSPGRRAFAGLVHALMNHHEFVTIR